MYRFFLLLFPVAPSQPIHRPYRRIIMQLQKNTWLTLVAVALVLILIAGLFGEKQRRKHETFLASLTNKQKAHIAWVRKALPNAPKNTLIKWRDGKICRTLSATHEEVRMKCIEAFRGSATIFLQNGYEKTILTIIEIGKPGNPNYNKLAGNRTRQQ